MSQSSLHADAFYQEVVKHGKVWGIKDEKGIPAPIGESGQRAMPFWSSLKRAKAVIETVEAYAKFEAFEITLAEFSNKWLVGLENDGLLVGINWSGERAVGYDVHPMTVKQAIEFQKSK